MPELFGAADFPDTDRRRLRARLEHPGWRDPRRPLVDAVVIDDVDELRTGNACSQGPRSHRELVAKSARDRLADSRHLQILTQHRGQLDVEVVERDDAIEVLGAGEKRRAFADVAFGHVAAHVMKSVDRVAGPVGVAQRLVGEQQDAASLAAAFAQELVAFAVRRDTEQRQGHLEIWECGNLEIWKSYGSDYRQISKFPH